MVRWPKESRKIQARLFRSSAWPIFYSKKICLKRENRMLVNDLVCINGN